MYGSILNSSSHHLVWRIVSHIIKYHCEKSRNDECPFVNKREVGVFFCKMKLEIGDIVIYVSKVHMLASMQYEYALMQ